MISKLLLGLSLGFALGAMGRLYAAHGAVPQRPVARGKAVAVSPADTSIFNEFVRVPTREDSIAFANLHLTQEADSPDISGLFGLSTPIKKESLAVLRYEPHDQDMHDVVNALLSHKDNSLTPVFSHEMTPVWQFATELQSGNERLQRATTGRNDKGEFVPVHDSVSPVHGRIDSLIRDHNELVTVADRLATPRFGDDVPLSEPLKKQATADMEQTKQLLKNLQQAKDSYSAATGTLSRGQASDHINECVTALRNSDHLKRVLDTPEAEKLMARKALEQAAITRKTVIKEAARSGHSTLATVEKKAAYAERKALLDRDLYHKTKARIRASSSAEFVKHKEQYEAMGIMSSADLVKRAKSHLKAFHNTQKKVTLGARVKRLFRSP